MKGDPQQTMTFRSQKSMESELNNSAFERSTFAFDSMLYNDASMPLHAQSVTSTFAEL